MIAISHYHGWSIVNYLLGILVVVAFLPFLWSFFIVMALLVMFFSQFFFNKKYHNGDFLNFIESDASYWMLCRSNKLYENLQLSDSLCLFQKIVFLRFKSPLYKRVFSAVIFFKKNELESLRNLQKIVFNEAS